jgi:hypothetical protein
MCSSPRSFRLNTSIRTEVGTELLGCAMQPIEKESPKLQVVILQTAGKG